MNYNVSTKKAAQMLDCTRRTLSSYVKDGILKSEKRGRETFYLDEEIIDMIHRNTISPSIIKIKSDAVTRKPPVFIFSISVNDTMKMLDCTRRTLTNYVKSGKLKSEKRGRMSFYNEHEILTLIHKKVIKQSLKKKSDSASIATSSSKLILPAQKNTMPQREFKYDIDGVGQKYVDVCREQMEELEIYNKAYEILLYDLGIQYQLYRQYLDESYSKGSDKMARQSDMYFKNVQGMLKELGLTPKAKASIGAKSKSKEDEQDLFSLIAEQLK